MSKRFILTMLVVMLSFMAASVQAQVIVTTADGDKADTYCPNDSQGGQDPDANFGSETRMRAFRQLTDVRSKTGYIRFDISNVAGDLTEAIMTFALTCQKRW